MAIVAEIIGAYSDRNRIARKIGQRVQYIPIDCGLIFTSEILPQNPSTLNRCMVVKVEESVDLSALSVFQDEKKDVFGAFVMALNNFIMGNYHMLKEHMLPAFKGYRSMVEEFPYNENSVNGFRRIMTNYALARITIDVLREMYLSCHVPTELVEKFCNRLVQAAKGTFMDLCESLSTEAVRHNYLDMIFDAYSQYIFQGDMLAEDADEYFDKPEYYLGIYMDDRLYVQGDKLMQHLEIEGAQTKNAIADQLFKWGLLKIDMDGKRSIHAPGTTRKTRFYAIDYPALVKLVYGFDGIPDIRL